MKTLIICFSQTSNTRKIAEKIRDGVIDETGRCDMEDLEEVDVDSLKDYDLIGLGCPVFYYQEPYNVRDFMEGLPRLKDKPWFVFCTHGAVMGRTLLSMTESLEKKGGIVIGSHDSYAGATIPFYPKPTLTSGHPDEQDLREAFEFGKAIVKCGKAVSEGDASCVSKPPPVSVDWAEDEAKMFTLDFLKQITPPLSINSETCVQCGECRDACPVDGIDIECEPPRIQEPCVYCFHCASICPTCSIEADWSEWVKMAPGNYARYEVALRAAEDRGEFRWLLDPKIVDCGDPLYKQRERALKDQK